MLFMCNFLFDVVCGRAVCIICYKIVFHFVFHCISTRHMYSSDIILIRI